MIKELKLCIIGFGSAARAFCEILLEKNNEIIQQFGYKVVVTDIATYSKGCIHKNNGINLSSVFECVDTKKELIHLWKLKVMILLKSFFLTL